MDWFLRLYLYRYLSTGWIDPSSTWKYFGDTAAVLSAMANWLTTWKLDYRLPLDHNKTKTHTQQITLPEPPNCVQYNKQNHRISPLNSMSRLARIMNRGVPIVETLSNGFATPHQQQSIRCKHSSTQVKRLFKRNPARFRVENRMGTNQEEAIIPEPRFQAILEPKILPNGWCPPPGPDVQVPDYPFQVRRTKNKPNDAVGFLPVYSEFR